MIRLLVKNEGEEDWRGCMVSIECDDYSDAETAEPVYPAKDLTLQGGSEVAEDGDGDEVVKCPPLTAGWVTVLSSEISGVGHMTHVGPRRLLFRLEDPSEDTEDVQWKLEWRSLGAANWIQTEEGSTPIIRSSPVVGDYQVVDLGECRPERAVTGDHRWEFRVQALSKGSSGKQPLIRDVLPMSLEQWLRVADTSDAPIDGEPVASGGTVANEEGEGTVAWEAKSGSGTMSFAEVSKYPTFAGTGISNYLKVTNFGFGSILPAGATPRGIIVRAVPLTASGVVEEFAVCLVVGGVIETAENKAGAGGYWSRHWNNPEVRQWGSPLDLWAQTGLTRAQVVATNFGVVLAVGSHAALAGEEVRELCLKRIEMIVAYSEGGNENRVCFASRLIEFGDSGVRRQHAIDEVWGEFVPEGLLLDAPVGGQEGKDARVLIVPSVGDFATRADSASVKLSAKVMIRPSFLFAREASGT